MNDNQPDASSLHLWARLGVKDFAACRRRFLDVSAAHAASLTSYAHPGSGPDGEELACDVAYFGNPHAPRVLIVTSGAHGLEGRAGSAIQSAWIESGAVQALPSAVAVLLVHAINPYGFAYERRNEATNVDPNRNFAASLASFPDNPGYRELHPILCPQDWTESTAVEINAKLTEYSARHGVEQLKRAVVAGQREFPDGLFYCGTQETWPVRTIKQVLRGIASHAERIGYMDFHTGLGGYGEMVYLCFHPPGSPGRVRARRWFGADAIDPTVRPEGQSDRYEGTMYAGIEHFFGDRDSTIVCVEFGTAEPEKILSALLLEHWLHFTGGKYRPENAERCCSVRQTFTPADPAWFARVQASGLQTINDAIQGLASDQP